MNALLALALAPVLAGLIGRVKAWVAGRAGAPLLQPCFEVIRLLRKGMVLSPATTSVFTLAPAVSLAALCLAALLVPLGGPAAVHFPGDLLAFVGLLALARLATVLAALDTGSSFEGMGASREVTLGALTEPALLLALGVVAAQSHGTSLTQLWQTRELGLWHQAGPVLALTLVALFIVLLAENARIPVDDPTTHLELTMIHEVMVLDHSGPGLACVVYGAALKLWLFAALLVGLLLPVHTGSAGLDLAAALGGVTLVGVAVGLVESTCSRMPLKRVPHYLVTASALAALALMLVVRQW